ncbi:uncharacterized protein M421DRAFT_345988 [Didymella exigua CBS 183.55]|uniref:Uncharacterized protein n=1 Tax=Didymella exigua CBS 183.55 TaxID=1150837 RepID=A0A6A5RUW6_9PLEO|nr:uncharacterized protein M421DRAFT_345988 [Didymella exigua CBS 183.55]KAF1931369.1 hypothetical protein M421DRAFT_345988 [Didymella exigua CBS 183.55]
MHITFVVLIVHAVELTKRPRQNRGSSQSPHIPTMVARLQPRELPFYRRRRVQVVFVFLFLHFLIVWWLSRRLKSREHRH